MSQWQLKIVSLLKTLLIMSYNKYLSCKFYVFTHPGKFINYNIPRSTKKILEQTLTGDIVVLNLQFGPRVGLASVVQHSNEMRISQLWFPFFGFFTSSQNLSMTIRLRGGGFLFTMDFNTWTTQRQTNVCAYLKHNLHRKIRNHTLIMTLNFMLKNKI